MTRRSVDDTGRADKFSGDPAGRCGLVLIISSELGILFPAGPSAITRNMYFVAGFRSWIRAPYCIGVSETSTCCHCSTTYSISFEWLH